MRPRRSTERRRVAMQVFFILSLVAVARAAEPEWHAARAPLMTQWSAQVSPTNTLPEYPRPHLARPDWLNLNGLWDYAITKDSTDKPGPFAGKILVPFPVESALSGVMTNLSEHEKLWYHRVVSVPPNWRGRRVRLHFGGVDWSCQVWMNGHKVGQHQGSYDSFTFDLTDALQWTGTEELSLCVINPMEGDQPRGKQSRKPEGIFYTATSGIWETAWLEPVPEVCLDSLKMVPDLDAGCLRLLASVNSLSDRLRIEAVASVAGKVIARVTGLPNSSLDLKIETPHLWSPDDPFLYDLKVSLKEGDQTLDSVGSYFGMRKIELKKDEQGFTRLALNGQFTFEIGTLDQGFWPDGIYTAPTDEALRSDIEFLKKAGFNLTRKHVKVEPDRWYYWCDKLGLLVWQDMPSGNNSTIDGRHDFENELLRLVGDLQNHPSIIVWVLFNEGWGQYDTERLTSWLKSLDPSRLVDDASGWTDMRTGDLIDIHSYPGPDAPTPEPRRAAVLGEFGGLGLAVPGHVWSSHSWGYSMLADASELSSQYYRALKQVWRLHALRGLSAVIYTQTSDVETECNGLLTYDRAVAKIDPAAVLAANQLGYLDRTLKVVLPDGLTGRSEWKITTEQPGEEWYKPGFDVSLWKQGTGGFGSEGTPGIIAKTGWKTSDIWLRREFALNAEDLAGLKLQVFHDEDAEIYLNGILAVKLSGFITDYGEFDISPESEKALHPGQNTISVHCHQTTGGQGIDVGILAPVPDQEPEKGKSKETTGKNPAGGLPMN